MDPPQISAWSSVIGWAVHVFPMATVLLWLLVVAWKSSLDPLLTRTRPARGRQRPPAPVPPPASVAAAPPSSYNPYSAADSLEAIRGRAERWQQDPTSRVGRRAAEDREILLQALALMAREKVREKN